MLYFVDVILPIPLEQYFTYRINEAEAAVLTTGIRVAVPFGKSKIYTALAFRLHQNPPEVYEAKAIHEILDEEPIVTAIQLKHWHWIAQYYMCTIGEVFRAAIPSALLLESETVILKKEQAIVEEKTLSDDEFLVFEALQHQSSLSVSDVGAILERKRILPILNTLIVKGVISLKEEIYEGYRPKMVRYVRLAAH